MDEKVAHYVLAKEYPKDCSNGVKANIRKRVKFFVTEGNMIYHIINGKKREVIRTADQQQAVIKQVHQGNENCIEDAAMAGHIGGC